MPRYPFSHVPAAARPPDATPVELGDISEHLSPAPPDGRVHLVEVLDDLFHVPAGIFHPASGGLRGAAHLG
jgi:hypothetical protein